MKLLLPLCLIIGLILGYLACALLGYDKETAAQHKGIKHTDSEQLRSIVQPLMDNMVQALQKKDLKLYQRDIQPELRSVTSDEVMKSYFDLLADKHGAIMKPQWLGAYRKGSTIVTVWKAKSGKGMDDILISMPILMMDDYVRVITFDLQ